MDDRVKENRVVKKGNKWCVVHGHPKKPGSKTDKPEGTIIKCFPTKKEADAMHRAIMANEISWEEVEAMMKDNNLASELRELEAFKINMPLRKEEFEGKPHLVAPVIAIVEGVHNGLYYPQEEIEKFVEAWNGVPVPIGHPKNKLGLSVSANSPDVIEEFVIGRFWNAFVEDGKLKGEIWIDEQKAKDVAPAVLDIIKGGGQLEVSTGLWTEDDLTSGEWHGEKYDAVMRSYRPDHLALLPGGKGACSWEDGCGVRVNKKKGGEQVEDEELFEKLEEVGKQKIEGPGKFKQMFIQLAKKLGFIAQEISHDELHGKLVDLINGEISEIGSGNGTVRYVNSVFDDYFIYEEHSEGRESKLLKQFYRVKSDDSLELLDEPVEVRSEVKFVPLEAEKKKEEETVEINIINNSNEEGLVMTEELKKLIDALIINEKTNFCEDDRAWLETLEEGQLKKLEPIVVEEKKEEPVVENKEEIPAEIKAEESKEEPEGEQKELTAEEYIKAAPEGVRETLERAVKRDRELKAKLVKGLMDNKRNTFTQAELEAKSMSELEALVKLADVPVDYTGKSGGPSENQELKENERHPDGSGVPDMPTMQWGNA